MSKKDCENPTQATETNEQNVEIIPGYSSIEQFTKEGYRTLMEAIRNSNALPNGRDWSFYCAHESFTKIISDEGNNLLKQINTILRQSKIEGNVRNRGLEEKTELMIEANDMILERVANNIDEMNGIRKTVIAPVLIQAVSAQLPINGSWNRVNSATFSVSSSITSEPSKKSVNAIRLLTGKNIVRPQKFFKDKIINGGKYPWEPRIKEKPNSLKPLAIFLEETENGEEYSHPYELELEKFTPLPDQLKKEKPSIPYLIENTPLVEINSPDQLDELVETLRTCKEFAVDLEHHSYRSFMGITCLMQISTRDKDYLIDTLALRHNLYVLNEVFTKASIVKIFHGADMDIKWLQRDLSIYVVNMFDTYQAAKQLGYSGLSLAYLMQKFCDFMPNKQFQLADWRIRPLPEELKAYAREDTHYLIYIYQMMRNELIDKANGQDNLLLSVIKSSTDTCKKRYFRPILRETSHLDFYRKCKRLFDNRQLYALKELYKWRDHISREEDESTGYVLPNHMLLQISETLPREMQGILACCNPIPPLVRANLLELHQIILRAKEQPLEKPILKEDTRARGSTKKISKINVDSPLHCPHDLTKTNEFRDDLPTLLGNTSIVSLKNVVKSKLNIERECPTYSVFDTPENSEEEVEIEAKKKLHKITFLGPFERYKLVKPYIQAEEERLAAEKAAEPEKTEIASSSKETPGGDTRTDEERIESIREHFLNLSRQTVNYKIPLDQSLIQMGGTKKRKRDLLPQEDPAHHHIPQNNLHTTVPNLNFNQYNRRKRKSSDQCDGDSPNKFSKPKGNNQSPQKRGFKNRNNQKGAPNLPDRQPNQNQNNQYEQDEPRPQKNKNKKNREKGNNQRGKRGNRNSNHSDTQDNYDSNQNQDGDDFESNNHGESSSYGEFQEDLTESFHIDAQGSFRGSSRGRGGRGGRDGKGGKGAKGGRGGRGERGGRGGRGNRGKKNTQSRGGHQPEQYGQEEEFEAYDYASVDFRQFQGGAAGVQRPQEFKSTFRGKGKKRGGTKSNNRSSTFGNSGRGRGRGR